MRLGIVNKQRYINTLCFLKQINYNWGKLIQLKTK